MNNSQLVTTVRRAGQLSLTDPNFTDALILDELTQALYDRFAEPVTTLRQGYWLQVSTSTSTGATNGLYRLPPRAVVQGLEKLEVSTDAGASFHPVSILTQTQASGYSSYATQLGQPEAYTLNGDCIRLFPPPAPDVIIRFTYYVRPPQLVAFTDTLRIVTVGASTLTVNSDPTSLLAVTGRRIDVQDADGSHELAVVDAPMSGSFSGPDGSSNYTITFVGPVPDLTLVAAGDYVRTADTSVFPMLPRELHRPLCDYVAAVILVAKGDDQKAQNLATKAEAGIKRVVQMAQPRIKSMGNFTWKRNSYLRRLRGA